MHPARVRVFFDTFPAREYSRRGACWRRGFMRTTRREFAKELSGAVITAAFARAGEPARLPIAFSTLGCPAWDMQKILNFAEQHGFAAIEFRGLQGNLDLPSHPAFADESIAQTKREILSRGLRVACFSSSASLHESDPQK